MSKIFAPYINNNTHSQARLGLRIWLRKSILLPALSCCLISCANSKQLNRDKFPGGLGNDQQYWSSRETNNEVAQEAPSLETLMPWLSWSRGNTLERRSFKDARISAADDLMQKFQYSPAIRAYKLVRPVGIDEAESLELRIASAELMNLDPVRAIASLSKFFQSRNKSENQVSDSSALFFGYAYGQAKNYEQALAWFSQAANSQDSSYRNRINQALSALLKFIPDLEFEEMSAVWKQNELISGLFAEERLLRQKRPALKMTAQHFWKIDETAFTSADISQTEAVSVAPLETEGKIKVAALLSLSGRFAKLGEAVRNGLEIALEKNSSASVALLPQNIEAEKGPELEMPGSSSSASAMVLDAVKAGASIIVGPLLSEQALEVSSLAHANSIPAIILSKGGNPELGNGVYRFGLTNEAQAQSLASALLRVRSNPRISLVYASDETGTSLAQALIAALKAQGVEPQSECLYAKGSSEQLMRCSEDLEKNPPELVFFGDNLKAAVQFFGGLSSELRKQVIPVGSALWDNQIELVQSKTILNGAIFVSAFYPDRSDAMVSEFLDRYKEKTNKQADFFAAQGFDVGLLLSAARLDGENGINLPSEIRGITGVARINAEGEISRELKVLRLIKGSIAPLTDLPSTNPFVASTGDLNSASSNPSFSAPEQQQQDPSIRN